jgi:hypothetical protein
MQRSRSRGDPPLVKRAIEGKQNHCSHNGKDKARGLAFRVPSHGATEKARKECTCETQDDTDDPASRVFTRHKEFRDDAYDEADKQSSDNMHDTF